MKKIYLLLFLFIANKFIFAQTTSDCHKEGGMFISEMGNFGHGEYVEFTVYGSTANPTAPVNLVGWIIDDNNKADKEVGNEPGHIRLGSEFSAVQPGTLIVIASKKDQPFELQGFPAYSNTNDRIITFGRGLDGYDDCPNYSTKVKNAFKDPSYDCKSINPFSDFKNYAALDNSHDAIQVRNKEGELVHALYWTDDYEEVDNPKAVDIRGLIKKSSFSVNNYIVDFIGKSDWHNIANFRAREGNLKGQNGVAGNPGDANNFNHGELIDKLKQGIFSSVLKASVNVKQQPSSKNNDGVLEVEISGGDSEYSITISLNGEYFRESKFSNNGVKYIKGLKFGKYDIIIDDKTGCNPVYSQIELRMAEIVCSGACKEIGIEPDIFCKYEWVSNKDIINTKLSKQMVCPKESTIYTLKVIEDGQIKYINFTVEVMSAELYPNISIMCPNTIETITVKGSNPTWYDGSKENSITIYTPGSYSVTVTNDKGCIVNGKVRVLDAEKDDDIETYFEESGFESFEDVKIEYVFGLLEPDLSGRNGCKLIDLSKDLLRINNQLVDFVEIVDEICETKPFFIDNFYITDNSRFCKDGNLVKVKTAFSSNSKTYWLHKYKKGNKERIYFKGNLNALLNTEGVISLHYDIVDGFYPKKEITEQGGNIIKISNTNYKVNIVAKLNYKVINLSKSNISTTASNSESIFEAALNKLFPSTGSLEQVINVDFFKGKSPAPAMKQTSVKIDYDIKFNYSFKYVNSFSEIDKRDNVLAIIDEAGSTTVAGKDIKTCGFDGIGGRFMVLDLDCFSSSLASSPQTVHSICHEEGHHLGLPHPTQIYGSANVMAYGTSSLNTTLKQKQEVALYTIQSLFADLRRKAPLNGSFSTKVIPIKGDIKTVLYNYLDNSEYSGTKYTPK